MEAFSQTFRKDFWDLLRWRRDVRHFRSDPVDEDILAKCLDAFHLAPSVGLSEPWKIVRVRSAQARAAVLENFEHSNRLAAQRYEGARARKYAALKLSGMQEAPVQLAVFCDEDTSKGHGLGVATQPEMRRYSVVSAVTLFWLATRSYGLGLGWVSIIDPDQLCADLDVPPHWQLVGYFCLGWPKETTTTPELESRDWEQRARTLEILQR